MMALVLLLLAVTSWAAELCPVKSYDEDNKPVEPLPRDHPVCVQATALKADYVKLVRAAGFTEETLPLALVKSEEVNAYYSDWGIRFTHGYFEDAPSQSTNRFVLAHEIGHAVQDREGVLEWRDSVEAVDPEAQLKRSRQVEAHADAIAVELLARAGLSAADATRGTAQFFGCKPPKDDPSSSHPDDGQRSVNAHLARVVLPPSAMKDKSARIVKLSQALGVAEGKVDLPPPSGPFRPQASVRDFDGQGRLLPGRLAVRDLHIEVPRGDVGFVREHSAFIASSLVDYWIAKPAAKVIDALTTGKGATRSLLAACLSDKEDQGGGGGPAHWSLRATRYLMDLWGKKKAAAP